MNIGDKVSYQLHNGKVKEDVIVFKENTEFGNVYRLQNSRRHFLERQLEVKQ